MTERRPIIESSAVTFFRLISEGLFTVPWHQRRYDWRPEDVDDLLQDIDDAFADERRCYFLGTVILVKAGSRLWRINDGQQRMVTLSLICACLRRLFSEHGDSMREHLALRVLFDVDEDSTQVVDNLDRLRPRLTPPRDDKTRYNLMIRGRNIGANGKLTQAWRLIDAFVLGMGVDKSQRFFDFLMQKLEVARLNIPASVDLIPIASRRAAIPFTSTSRASTLCFETVRGSLITHAVIFSAGTGSSRRLTSTAMPGGTSN